MMKRLVTEHGPVEPTQGWRKAVNGRRGRGRRRRAVNASRQRGQGFKRFVSEVTRCPEYVSSISTENLVSRVVTPAFVLGQTVPVNF